MNIQAIKTEIVNPNDNLFELIDKHIPICENGDILVVTSKIVSLAENRVIPKSSNIDKKALVRNETCSHYYDDFNMCLTITYGHFVGNAGIDESNVQEAFVLYPQYPFRSANAIKEHVIKRDNLKDFGVIISDSYVKPLRIGTLGFALSWCGIVPLNNYIGKPDLFGRNMKMTQLNVVDSIASATTLCMGEGSECTPLAIVKNANLVQFTDELSQNEDWKKISIPPEDDLYRSIFRSPDEMKK
jgi:coenzyme F420-0:L-glutamate ligase